MVIGTPTGVSLLVTYNITYEYKLRSMTLPGGRSFVSAGSDGTWEGVVGSGNYTGLVRARALQHRRFLEGIGCFWIRGNRGFS